MSATGKGGFHPGLWWALRHGDPVVQRLSDRLGLVHGLSYPACMWSAVG
ncbi:hypothetical protein ACWD0Z_19325 [Streptomyces sp. NPDC003007]